MKKILTSAFAIVLFIGAAQAQDGSRNHDRKGREFGKELNLTEDQKAKLKSLHEAERNEMRALDKNSSASKEQRKAVHEKYKTQYEAILTPAQRDEWNQKKEQMKDGRREGRDRDWRGKDDQFGQMGAFYKKELNLTADQETKLKNIFGEYRTKAQDLRANNTLTADQKKTQMQSLAQQYMDQGKAVLTPDQLQKLNNVKSERKHKRNSNV